MRASTWRSATLVTALCLVAAGCSSTQPSAAPTSPATAAATAPVATAAPAPTQAAVPADSPGQTQAPAPVPTEAPVATPVSVGSTPTAPQMGGTLVIGDWSAPSNLNPMFSTALATVQAIAPALRGLLTTDEDGQWATDLGLEVPSLDNGNVVRDADGDGFTLILKLKPDLLWSDGTPLTMNDLKATYDWSVAVGKANVGCTGCPLVVPQIDPGITDPDKLWAPANQYIQDIAVSDDGLTATLTWRHDFAGWLGWASNWIFQAGWLSTITPELAPRSMPVGPGIESVPWNGPFNLIAASTDGIDYDRSDTWKAGPPAWLDHLRAAFFGEKDGMISAFLSGDIDLAFSMTQADYPALESVDPAIGRPRLDPAWQYQHFDLQTGRKDVGLDDLRVRKAIEMAIDKQDMVDALFPGAGVQPACNGTPPGTWWRDETVTCPAYDPAGAMALLDEAGWTANPVTGNREKDVDGDGTPEPLRLRLCVGSGNPTRITEVSKLNGYLLVVGIPSDIESVDPSSVLFAGWSDTTPETSCSIYRGTYDMADFAYVLSADLYGDYFYSYHASQIPSDKNPNGSNDTRLSVPEMDEALDALASEVDPEKQKAIASTIQHILAEQVNEIPIYYRAAVSGVSNHVGGWGKFNPSAAGPTWDVESLFYIP